MSSFEPHINFLHHLRSLASFDIRFCPVTIPESKLIWFQRQQQCRCNPSLSLRVSEHITLSAVCLFPCHHSQLPDTLDELHAAVRERKAQADRIMCPNPHVLQQYEERVERVRLARFRGDLFASSLSPASGEGSLKTPQMCSPTWFIPELPSATSFQAIRHEETIPLMRSQSLEVVSFSFLLG